MGKRKKNVQDDEKTRKEKEKRREESRKRKEDDDIHERVKYYRIKTGKDQKDLAVLVPCCPEYICKIENKKVDPSHSFVKRIRAVLNLTAAEFYDTEIPKEIDAN